jgi:hypothetical protein
VGATTKNVPLDKSCLFKKNTVSSNCPWTK